MSSADPNPHHPQPQPPAAAQPMTAERIEEIHRLMAVARTWVRRFLGCGNPGQQASASLVETHIPALLAEVDRLQAVVEGLEAAVTKTKGTLGDLYILKHCPPLMARDLREACRYLDRAAAEAARQKQLTTENQS